METCDTHTHTQNKYIHIFYFTTFSFTKLGTYFVPQIRLLLHYFSSKNHVAVACEGEAIPSLHTDGECQSHELPLFVKII